MGSPDITTQSLQVTEVLEQVISRSRNVPLEKSLYDVLSGLRLDLEAVFESASNIYALFSTSSFVEAIQQIQDASNISLTHSLTQSFDNCFKDAWTLPEVLIDLSLDSNQQEVEEWLRVDRGPADRLYQLRWRFEDHRRSLSLAYELFATCEQMRILDTERNELGLRNKILDLKREAGKLSSHITSRQIFTYEEDRLRVLQEISKTSEAFQQLATTHLEHFVSLRKSSQGARHVKEGENETESTNLPVIGSKPSPMSAPPEEEQKNDIFQSNEPSRSFSADSPRPANPAYGDTGESSTIVGPNSQSRAKLDSSGSINNESLESSYVDLKRLQTELTKKESLSAAEFEGAILKLLAFATVERMGVMKPFSDDVIDELSKLLKKVGKHSWSERPRTYLVLRLINEVRVMDSFVLEGFKDIDFPYTNGTLPNLINIAGARHNFLFQQRYVLSPKSADLNIVLTDSSTLLENLARADLESWTKYKASLHFKNMRLVSLSASIEGFADCHKRKRISRSGAFAKDRNALAHFENEIHNLKRLSHFHLVEFVGSYTDRRYIGIIMRPVAESDLHHHLTKSGLSTNDLVILRSFIGCLCSALAYLHKNKCRHKDLKPQNILIQRETVLLTDFGTALDWTESDSDVTSGTPKAFTGLYIAPEVARNEKRDGSSDIWSLGCVFLEIATILAGVTLEHKSKFFQSLESPSTAYWQNHDAIARWTSQLRDTSGNTDASLYEWIDGMTAWDPGSRPNVDQLTHQVLMENTKSVRYGRSCCFEDMHSDDTSWKGSIEEVAIFDTAQAPSDETTISSRIPPKTLPIISETLLEQRVSSPGPQLEVRPASSHYPGDDHKLGTTEPTNSEVGLWKAANYSPIARKPIFNPSLPEQDQSVVQIRAEQQQELLIKTLPHSEEVLITDDKPSSTINKDFQKTEDVFLQSHLRLEQYLIQLRRNDDSWRSRLLEVAERRIRDQKGFTILLAACNFNNVRLSTEAVQAIVHEKPDLINETTMYGNSPLHYAAFKGRNKLLKFLLENGASPSLQNFRGDTPLHLSLIREKRYKTAELLIPFLSPDQVNIKNDIGFTAVFLAAANHSVVKSLIRAGALVNEPTTWGNTPIQLSANRKQEKITHLLEEEILKVNPDFKMTPFRPFKDVLSVCEGKQQSECFCGPCRFKDALVTVQHDFMKEHIFCSCENHGKVYQKDCLSPYLDWWKICNCVGCLEEREYYKQNPICASPINNEYLPYNDSLQQSTQIQAPYTNPPSLPIAADFSGKRVPPYPGHEYFDRLIDDALHKANSSLEHVDANSKALKALAEAGFKGSLSYRKVPNDALAWLIMKFENVKNAKEITEILIRFGADLSLKCDDANYLEKRSLIESAARYQHLPLLKFLLERNDTIKDQAEDSRLRFAVIDNKPLSTRMLLRAGVDVNKKTPSGNTMLHLTNIENKAYMIPLLLAHGASTELVDKAHNTPLHKAISNQCFNAVAALLEGGADIEALKAKDATPLSLAMKQRAFGTILELLRHGADIHRTCNMMPCALFDAISKGYSTIAQILLEEYGADEDDIYQVLSDGRNALHILADSSMKESSVIEKLMTCGIHVNDEDLQGKTALHHAASRGNIAVAKALMAHNATLHIQDHEGFLPSDYAQNSELIALLGGKRVTVTSKEKERKKRWWRK